jgi:hypothetical protein
LEGKKIPSFKKKNFLFWNPTNKEGRRKREVIKKGLVRADFIRLDYSA